jgi:Flp pilus assembly pilin Flp
MSATKKMLRDLLCDERGLETVEYAIIAGLIVAGVIATVTSIGLWVAARFDQLDAGLAGGGVPAP